MNNTNHLTKVVQDKRQSNYQTSEICNYNCRYVSRKGRLTIVSNYLYGKWNKVLITRLCRIMPLVT